MFFVWQNENDSNSVIIVQKWANSNMQIRRRWSLTFKNNYIHQKYMVKGINVTYIANMTYIKYKMTYIAKFCPSRAVSFFIIWFCLLNLKKHIQQNNHPKSFKKRIRLIFLWIYLKLFIMSIKKKLESRLVIFVV